MQLPATLRVSRAGNRCQGDRATGRLALPLPGFLGAALFGALLSVLIKAHAFLIRAVDSSISPARRALMAAILPRTAMERALYCRELMACLRQKAGLILLASARP
jgi:hypothetical protein